MLIPAVVGFVDLHDDVLLLLRDHMEEASGIGSGVLGTVIGGSQTRSPATHMLRRVYSLDCSTEHVTGATGRADHLLSPSCPLPPFPPVILDACRNHTLRFTFRGWGPGRADDLGTRSVLVDSTLHRHSTCSWSSDCCSMWLAPRPGCCRRHATVLCPWHPSGYGIFR
jgi:hypothetical protein